MHFREQNWIPDALDFTGSGETTLTVLPFDFDISFLDVSVNFFVGTDGGFDASIIVNTDLYEPATAELFANRLLRVLEAFAESPEVTLRDLDVLPTVEHDRILDSWSVGPDPAIESAQSVGSVLDASRNAPADRIAVQVGAETITYGELAARIDSVPAQVNSAAASVDGVVRLLAALDRDAVVLPTEATASPDGRDVRLAAASWGSPDVGLEVVAALADSATIVFAADPDNPADLADLVVAHEPTQVLADPYVLAKLAHSGVSMMPSVHRWVATRPTGPALLPEVVAALSADSTRTYRYRPAELTNIAVREGRPVCGARVLVLDEAMAPVPHGVVGDVYVGGSALDEVIADPTRLVTDPYAISTGAQLFRTGDRARWSSSGALLFEAATRDLEVQRSAGVVATGAATGTERTLIAILEELLEIDDVEREDGFFALGGDSVISIQWAGRANDEGLPLTPQMIFEYITIAELAAAVDVAKTSEAETVESKDDGVQPDQAPNRHEPMSASGLSDNALATLTASWKAGS